MGTTNDQADAGIAVLTHVVLAQGGQAVADEVIDVAAIVQLFVLKILRAGVGGTAEDEHALALLGAVRQIRADGIQAHVGGQCDDIGLKIAGKVRLGVHFSSLGNVTALDIGNDRQAGGAGHFQRFGVGAHTVQAQGLVVGDLHFVAARHALGGVNQGAVKRDDILPCRPGGVGGGQVADFGIQPHADRAVRGNALVQFVHVGKHADSSV